MFIYIHTYIYIYICIPDRTSENWPQSALLAVAAATRYARTTCANWQ